LPIPVKSIKQCIIEEGTKKKFFQRESGKTFTLFSNKKFKCKIIDIDNCCFKGVALRRCDFLFLVAKDDQPAGVFFEKNKAFFVELKGDNITSACEQLYNAIDKTKVEIPIYTIEAKVIGTKGFQPNIQNNEYFRKVKKLIKREIDFHKVGRYNGYNHIENI